MSKTILEKALLEAEQLEDTMRSNAKEILSSTMKEEIHELVKESLSENDYLKEQEDEEEVDFDLDVDDDEALEVLGMPAITDVEDNLELGIDDDTADEVELELPPLDLTLASDAEVLKVFKAMGDEDGIIIQQDDNEIDLTDTNTDTEYLIKLEQSKKQKVMNEQDIKDVDEGMPAGEDVDPSLDEEVVYEIELGEDMEDDVDEMVGEPMENHEHDGFEQGDERAGDVDYRHARHGDQKRGHGESSGDQGKSRLSFLTKGGHSNVGGNKGDISKTHAGMDYDLHAGEEEGVKGDQTETSRLKAGPNSSFSRMAGQKVWGKQRESRKSRKTNLGESRLRKSYNLLKEEVESLKTKNGEYKKALVTFKDKLNEVSVFNSNLAYVTRLFTEHSTTKHEKINILKRFDNVASLKDSKGLYKVIKEEFSQTTKKSNTISEAVERKITKSSTKGSGGKLLESKVYENEQFSRMKDLMSKL